MDVSSRFEELSQRVIFEVVLDVLDIFVEVELLIKLGVDGHLVGSDPEVVVVDDVVLVSGQKLDYANRQQDGEHGVGQFAPKTNREVICRKLDRKQPSPEYSD